jgi:hypothetical protein
VWTLWYRRDRKQPWELVATCPSYRACFDALADDTTHHHGDWWWGPGDQPPRNVNHTIPRRAKA